MSFPMVVVIRRLTLVVVEHFRFRNGPVHSLFGNMTFSTLQCTEMLRRPHSFLTTKQNILVHFNFLVRSFSSMTGLF